jgi:hypothetical protein
MQLHNKLRDLGLSFIGMQGHYIEGYGSSSATDVEEESFFVVGLEKTDEEFKDILMSLGKEFQQDSVVFKPGSSVGAILIGTQDTNEEGDRL